MSGHRPGARLLRLATASAALAFYAVWVRPRILTWGATPDETIGTYPGDELIPDPNGRGHELVEARSTLAAGPLKNQHRETDGAS